VSRFDLAVVGGGPCGASATIMGAQAGLSVALISRRDAQHKPGETAHPAIEPLLDQLGTGNVVRSAGFMRHPGHWVVAGKRRVFVPYGADDRGSWLGFQLWRPQFEAILLERAVAAGATLRSEAAETVLVEDGKIIGLTTRTTVLEACWTLDCTGRAHWIARRLGLGPHRFSSRLIARFGYCPADERTDEFPVFMVHSGAWRWTAQVRPGLLAWTTLDLGGSNTLPTKARLAGARGDDVTWRSMPCYAGPGWLAGGDAAFLLDPGAGQGIVRAMASGIAMAHFAGAAIRGMIRADDAAAAYETWLASYRDHVTTALRGRYLALLGIDPFAAAPKEH
jgi:flavin-dependent dehydrogenase